MDLLTEAEAQVHRSQVSRLPEADLARRQAAEKMWGFIASELNQAFRAARLAVEDGPRAHRDREKWLAELDPRGARGFMERHRVFADLHGECFYEGNCPAPAVLEAKVREARSFVDEVKKALAEAKRHGSVG